MNMNIPDEIFILISEFLNDKDMSIYIRSCKYIKNLFYKNGFLKNLKYFYDTKLFSYLYYKHNKTLNSIYVCYLNNANCYLSHGSLPKIVNFYNCFIDFEINSKNPKTEILKITYKFTKINA